MTERAKTPASRIARAARCVVDLALIGLIVLAIGQRRGGPARGLEEARGDGSRVFVRGDANDDGEIDISDAVTSLGYLFLGNDPPPCLAAADCDDDGAVDISDAVFTLDFLFRGGPTPAPPYPLDGVDPTEDLGCRQTPLDPLPEPGSLGGPDVALAGADAERWRRGRALFDRPALRRRGLGPVFNGDSCRACHLDPVVGGAGGLDVDVVRFARYDETSGATGPLDGGPAVSRLSILGHAREEVPADANVIETRQTPTLLGLGLVDRIDDAVIRAGADPDDADGDGISGRVREVGGRAGRFGHKAGVPSLADFTADALFNELGLTVDPARSTFAVGSDDDAVADPEVAPDDFDDLAFFIAHLAPPPRRLPAGEPARASIAAGEHAFLALGCASCHVPSLPGSDGPVAAYSDFLLHDVADPGRRQVDEPGVEPREFRTAPLWGLRDTAPYLHDGSAETIEDAVLQGHHGEASAARAAYQALPFASKLELEDFLASL